MAKCVRCGKAGMGVLHSAIKLKDKNMICSKCYKELGGSPLKDMTSAPLLYTYEDIKDGFDAYYKNRQHERIKEAVAESVSVKITGAGQPRDLVCTEEERELFDIIRSKCDDVNLDADVLRLVRKSDTYVTVVMESSSGDLLDLARIKYTNKAKWIEFAPNFERIQLEDVEDIAKKPGPIYAAYRFNEPYL